MSTTDSEAAERRLKELQVRIGELKQSISAALDQHTPDEALQHLEEFDLLEAEAIRLRRSLAVNSAPDVEWMRARMRLLEELGEPPEGEWFSLSTLDGGEFRDSLSEMRAVRERLLGSTAIPRESAARAKRLPERVAGTAEEHRRDIHKVLVANRGEIACRIFRTCRTMGIATVAVYSEADRHLPHVAEADEAVCIGEAAPSASYLNIEAILDAARRTRADAIHPGYGFLSENPDFAKAVEAAGRIWIGPPPGAIVSMGDKAAARQLAQSHGLPVVPGYDGDDDSEETLIREAESIGVPLLVKASAGGGGRGMRRVDDLADLPEAIASARREAQSAFGSSRLLLEKYVVQPRHIEIQVIADRYGQVTHLGERECSIQRRHQKVLEEAPSPVVSPALRHEMGEAARRLARAVNYVGAGTVELLLGADGDWYFLEMNTRLQVEHPVTEWVTGTDLVEMQIQLAEGQRLPAMDAVPLNGHAIEARLYAEDPFNDYLPGSGRLVRFDIPDEVRVDAGYGAGDEVGIHYDPMIAKIIAHGHDRASANRNLMRALRRAWVPGLTTNLSLLRQVVEHPSWRSGDFSTAFLSQHDLPEMPPANLERGALAAAVWGWLQQGHEQPSGWRMWGRHEVVDVWTYLDQEVEVGVTDGREGLQVRVGDRVHRVRDADLDGDQLTLEVDGHRWKVRVAHAGPFGDGVPLYVHLGDGEAMVTRRPRLPAPLGLADEPGTCVAPTPGVVRAVHVAVGDEVEDGTLLVTVEAMKMEHQLRAPMAGTVDAVRVVVGDAVEQGALLVKLETEAS